MNREMNAKAESTRGIVVNVLVHTLIILILLVLPEVVMAIARPHRMAWTLFPGFYIKIALSLGVFYFNYFWFVDRTLGAQKPKIIVFLLANLGLIAVVAVGMHLISVAMMGDHMPWMRHRAQMTPMQELMRRASFVLRDSVMLVLVIALATAMRLSARWQDMQRQRQEIIAAQKATELDNLKGQLNPHFLFNTLNTIYALVDIDTEQAKDALHRLSNMLRYVLYENPPRVHLSREYDFMADYCSLMQRRISSKSHPVEVNLDIRGFEDKAVAPLLFIPLVENAFKYGSRAATGTSISVTLSVEKGMAVCRTVNSFNAPDPAEKHAGIGLVNLRKRLTLIYGKRARLQTRITADVYSAMLSVPLESIGQ